MKQSKYQEIVMPNGTYVVEKRMGSWMAWRPEEDQAFIFHEAYEMIMMFIRQDSKETEHD